MLQRRENEMLPDDKGDTRDAEAENDTNNLFDSTEDYVKFSALSTVRRPERIDPFDLAHESNWEFFEYEGNLENLETPDELIIEDESGDSDDDGPPPLAGYIPREVHSVAQPTTDSDPARLSDSTPTTLDSTPTIKLAKRLTKPAGQGSKGISALSITGRLGSSTGPDMQLRLDSCAEVTLASHELYLTLPNRPALKKGMKLKLWALTNQVRILGYIDLSIFVRTSDGRTLEFVEEVYIVPGMNVPILLGEDFQDNYDLSIIRSRGSVTVSLQANGEDLLIPASNTNSAQLGFRVMRVGSDKEKAYAHDHPSPPSPPADPLYVRAAQDITIPADHSSRVQLTADFT